MSFAAFGFTHTGESAFTVEDCRNLFSALNKQRLEYQLGALYSTAHKDGTVYTKIKVWPPPAFKDVEKNLNDAFGLEDLKLVNMGKNMGLDACKTGHTKRSGANLRRKIYKAVKGHCIFLRHNIPLGLFREVNPLYEARTNWNSTDDEIEDPEQADEP
jgi:hypothetical protein